MKHRFTIIMIVATTCSGLSQQHNAAYFEKVQSLDSTLETLYAVISGEKHEPRDWELFKFLFYPKAQLMPIQIDDTETWAIRSVSVDGYIKKAGKWLEENGFFEREIHRVVETYGPLTHVFSTYESYFSQKDETPFARGINSIQLLNDGERWWVVNIYWFGETETQPIPKKYLPRG
jgi:hypothetical protein